MLKGNNSVWDSIYRQWISADYLRNCFEDILPEKELNLKGDFTIEPYWMFMQFSIFRKIIGLISELYQKNIKGILNT